MAEAQAPTGTYRLLRTNPRMGSTLTKRLVAVFDSPRPNVLSILVRIKDGRQSHPQNRYSFDIDSDELVTKLTGTRELGYKGGTRDTDIPIAPKFEDVLSIIKEAHRIQTKSKS